MVWNARCVLVRYRNVQSENPLRGASLGRRGACMFVAAAQWRNANSIGFVVAHGLIRTTRRAFNSLADTVVRTEESASGCGCVVMGAMADAAASLTSHCWVCKGCTEVPWAFRVSVFTSYFLDISGRMTAGTAPIKRRLAAC
jgi:hypothetical protein